jgi:hypothetical protein
MDDPLKRMREEGDFPQKIQLIICNKKIIYKTKKYMEFPIFDSKPLPTHLI